MNRNALAPRPALALLAAALLAAAAAAGCGPLVAQGLRATEGVESSSVLPGSGPAPAAGARLAILSPFAKTADSFYICRGEDEENLAAALRDTGRFGTTEAVHRRKAEDAAALAAALKGKSPARAKEELGLPFEPDAVVTGTLLRRRTLVSPFRGVIMEESFRLVFHDLRSGSDWSVEVAVKTLAEKGARTVAAEVARLAAAKR